MHGKTFKQLSRFFFVTIISLIIATTFVIDEPVVSAANNNEDEYTQIEKNFKLAELINIPSEVKLTKNLKNRVINNQK